MPRRKVPLVTDELYHVINRGNNSTLIYKDKWDYKRFLSTLNFYRYSDSPTRFSNFLLLPQSERLSILNNMEKENEKLIDILSFCLMPNHFHFLLKQKIDNGITKFIGAVSNSYSHYFNTKHNRMGALFGGRFKSIRIESSGQLVHVNRYIHLNPYSSSVVKSTKDLFSYPYSSLPEYLGDMKEGWCEKDTILSSFKDTDDYREFIVDQADYQRSLDIIKHQTLE